MATRTNEAAEPTDYRELCRVAANAARCAVFEFDARTGIGEAVFEADVQPSLRPFAAAFGDPAARDALIVEGHEERRAAVAAAAAGRGAYCVRYSVDAGGETIAVREAGDRYVHRGRIMIGCTVKSVAEEERKTNDLNRRANYDALTGALNRPPFCAALAEAIEARDDRRCYLLVAIDDLGAVNAEFGFEAADEAIREIARRIATALEDGDVIGRVAGNKFGLVLADCADDKVRARCAELISIVRSDLVDTAAGPVSASISIGAAPVAGDVASAEIAMVRGEAALNNARRMGPSSWSLFTDKLDKVSQRQRNAQMSDLILSALNERRVVLAYQPIVGDLGDKPHHYECLVRMRDREGGLVPAPEFIPAAERLGLVHLLDRRVLEIATATLKGAHDVRLNINVSLETIKDPVWVEGYLSHLRANADVAPRITVELTETQAIDAFDATNEFVSEIKELGCRFAIDDFGAGYTSFRNLKALDIDILKIDGSFVTGFAGSRENQLFVRALLDLARNFGVRTVAEWVDDETDALMLKGLGVDFLQGFLIGAPEVEPAWAADASAPTRLNTRAARG